MRLFTNLIIFFTIAFLCCVSTAYSQFELLWERENPMGLDNIHGVTINPDNNHMYIAQYAEHVVYHFDEELEEVETLDPGLGEIRGIGFDTDQNRLVVSNGGQFVILSLAGEVLQTIRANGNSINSVDYDPERELYIVGYWNSMVGFYSRDGQQVAQFNTNENITGVCYYPVNNSVFVMDGDDPVREYNMDGEQIGDPLQGDQLDGNGQDLAYNPNLRILYATSQTGPCILYAFDDNYGALPEPDIEPEAFELNLPIGMVHEEFITIGNGGEEGSVLVFLLEDVGEGVDWLDIDPVEGSLELNQEMEITLTIDTRELNPGEIVRTVLINTNCPDFRQVEIPVAMTVFSGFGDLAGTVTDVATDEPVADAQIIMYMNDRPVFEAMTNEDGEYNLEDIYEWVYEVEVIAADYLTQRIMDVEIIDQEVTALNIGLLYAICELSIDNINEMMSPDEEVARNVTMRNPGNGPLSWNVEKVLPDEMMMEPWTHRASFPASDIVENTRLGGIEFADDHFYVAGGIRGEDNPMYLLDREGNLVDQFPQFVESNYGMRDLAFDGELLWGVDGDIISGFTPGGELITQFESPAGSMRGITWDPMNEILWVCGITTDIFGVNRNGEEAGFIRRPAEGLRIYGMSWFPEDIDGFYMYLFCGNGETQHQIFKLNPDNGEAQFVAEPDIEGQAGAATVSNTWDPYSWVFIGLTRSEPDNIEVWHLAAPENWVQIEPAGGVVEPEDETELMVTLNSEGLPLNLDFEADFVFTHDGRGGEVSIPVLLNVTEGGAHTSRTLNLNHGWNMVSVNVDPDEHDVVALTSDLLENGWLDLMKNGGGEFYNPEFNFNNIPGWFVEQGYLIKVNDECELTIEGTSVNPDDPIALHDGWQMVAYYPRNQVDAIVALSGIEEQLLIAKDGYGNFYSPEYGFSNMGDMREGQGYLIKMDGDGELVYAMRGQEALLSSRSTTPVYFPSHPVTDNNMSLLLIAEDLENAEIGVFASGSLVGSGCVVDGSCGIAVWGDDSSTEKLDGAVQGDKFEIHIWQGETLLSEELTILAGRNRYESDGFLVMQLSGNAEIPESFGISSVYPNPFNSKAALTFTISEDGPVKLAVYDLEGRLVQNIVNQQLKAGTHTASFDGIDAVSGVYIAKLSSRSQSSLRKITLVK